MVPTESAPQELSDEWSCQYVWKAEILVNLLLIYPTCIDPSQQFAKNIRANPSKITQIVLKEFLCVEMKSLTLLIILGWVFL
jgi:hypothetical protein